MNKQEIIKSVENKGQEIPTKKFRVGDTVRVHVKITEGTTTRVQVFEGLVIGFKGQGGTRTFTVRKLSFGVGVERIFPLTSPSIKKIESIRSGHVRRAKLYYLRSRVGKAARLEEKESSGFKSKKKPSNSSSKPSNPPPEKVLVKAENK